MLEQLEDNVDSTLQDISEGKDYPNKTLFAIEFKPRIDNRDLIKIIASALLRK